MRLNTDIETSASHNLFNALASAMTGRLPELAVAVAASLDGSPDFREGWLVSVKDQLLDPRTPQATYLQICCALTRTLQQLCMQRRSDDGRPCVILDTTLAAAAQAGRAPTLLEPEPWPPLDPCASASTSASRPDTAHHLCDGDLRPPSWLLLPAGRRFFRAGIWHATHSSWSEAQRLVHDFAEPTRPPRPLLEELLGLVLCALANPTSMFIVSSIDLVMSEWRSLLASQARLVRCYHVALEGAKRALAEAQRQFPPITASSTFRSEKQRRSALARAKRGNAVRDQRVLAVTCELCSLDRNLFQSLHDVESIASHEPRLRDMLWSALARTCGVVEALRLGWAGGTVSPLVHAMMGYGSSRVPPGLAAPPTLYAPQVGRR